MGLLYTLSPRRVVSVRGRRLRLLPGLDYLASDTGDSVFDIAGVGPVVLPEDEYDAFEWELFEQTFIRSWQAAPDLSSLAEALRFTGWGISKLRAYAHLLAREGVQLPPRG
jgi:hypothetical protein